MVSMFLLLWRWRVPVILTIDVWVSIICNNLIEERGWKGVPLGPVNQVHVDVGVYLVS